MNVPNFGITECYAAYEIRYFPKSCDRVTIFYFPPAYLYSIAVVPNLFRLKGHLFFMEGIEGHKVNFLHFLPSSLSSLLSPLLIPLPSNS